MADDSLNAKLEQVYHNNVSNFVELVGVERLSGGASQETYRIIFKSDTGEVTHALRRAPGGAHIEAQVGHPGLETEALLMQRARDNGVPAPEVYYVLQPEDDLGDGFIMQWLDGEALGARITRLDKYESLRENLAYEVGKVLAKVHEIDLDKTGLRQKLDVVSPEDFVNQMWDRYKLLETPIPMIDYVGRWLMDNIPADYELGLVHNDFRCGNFMVTESEIVAVLDWEIAHIGDPMRDLGWICVNSWRFGSELPVGGFGQYEDFFRGYEEVSGKTVDPAAVKFWEVFGSFWWSVSTLFMAEQGRIGPDMSVERAGIGRRSSECQIDCVNLLIPGEVSLVKPSQTTARLDVPGSDELLSSVMDFLRTDVMSETKGRTSFLARVAANSLDIVLREWQMGETGKQEELSRLQAFFDSADSLIDLRWRLTTALRDGSQSLENELVQHHLRNTVANQIAIDQPKYSGFKKAIAKQ